MLPRADADEFTGSSHTRRAADCFARISGPHRCAASDAPIRRADVTSWSTDTFREVAGGEHVTIAKLTASRTIEWDRVATLPARPSCTTAAGCSTARYAHRSVVTPSLKHLWELFVLPGLARGATALASQLHDGRGPKLRISMVRASVDLTECCNVGARTAISCQRVYGSSH
jgi:hypothetical protein